MVVKAVGNGGIIELFLTVWICFWLIVALNGKFIRLTGSKLGWLACLDAGRSVWYLGWSGFHLLQQVGRRLVFYVWNSSKSFHFDARCARSILFTDKRNQFTSDLDVPESSTFLRDSEMHGILFSMTVYDRWDQKRTPRMKN